MKKLIGASFLALMSLSLSSFAEKLVITGQPILLEKNGEVYVVPEDFVVSGDSTFVVLDGVQHVCYATVQTALSTLTPKTINVTVGGKTVNWNCYPYDASFFEIKP